MKKVKYIDEVIGGILFPLGFERVKHNSDWTYNKQIINSKNEIITLQVLIYKHRFDTSLFMELWSSAAGRGTKSLRDFPGSDPIYGCISYTDDDDFKLAIDKIRNILQMYGIEWLNASTEPAHDDYPKEEDYRKLYLEHEQLADCFEKRMNTSIEDISLRESFDVIEKAMVEEAGKSFKEMLPLFLEMCAFLAKVVGKKKKYEWRMEEYYKQLRCDLYVYNKAGTTEEKIMIMHTLYVGWKRKGDRLIEQLIELFHLPPDDYVCESKLKT